MYDYEINIEDNEYLAEMAKTSPRWARATLDLELRRS